jgi:hypothetical protein
MSRFRVSIVMAVYIADGPFIIGFKEILDDLLKSIKSLIGNFKDVAPGNIITNKRLL